MLGAPKIRRELCSLGNTELLIDFPTYIPFPAEIRYYVNRGGSPPLLPEQEESEPRTTLTVYSGTEMHQEMQG